MIYSCSRVFLGAAALLFVCCSFSEASDCALNSGPTASSHNEGPFYLPDVPIRDRLAPEDILADPTNVLVVEGHIFGNDCSPVSNAIVEVWYAGPPDASGNYYSVAGGGLENRGKLLTDECGRYSATQAYPELFLGSPHVHFRVSIEGESEPLIITEMYFEETLAASFQPDGSQVVRVSNEADGSRRAVFNIHVDVPGAGSIDECGVSIGHIQDPLNAPNSTQSSPDDNGTPAQNSTTYGMTVSGNNNCKLAHGHLPVTALGGAPHTKLALTTRGTTRNGEHSGLDSCNGIESTSPAAWFTVEGSGGLMVTSTCWPGTDFDTKISVFGGPNCTFLSCEFANDDASTVRSSSCLANSLASRASWKSVQNSVYFIMVHGFADRTGSFELSVETLNDRCGYAAPLAIGDRVMGNTKRAGLPLNGAVGRCQKDGGIVGSTSALWYSVLLETSKLLEVTTCDDATEVDTSIHIFTACDDISTCMGGDYNDFGCATYQWEAQPFVQYHVLVSSTSLGGEGAFALNLRELEPSSAP